MLVERTVHNFILTYILKILRSITSYYYSLNQFTFICNECYGWICDVESCEWSAILSSNNCLKKLIETISTWSTLKFEIIEKVNNFRDLKNYSFYVIQKRKPSFLRDSNPRPMYYEVNSLPVYRWAIWLADVHKSNVYQVSKSLCTNQSSVYAIVTKWQIVNNLEQDVV